MRRFWFLTLILMSKHFLLTLVAGLVLLLLWSSVSKENTLFRATDPIAYRRFKENLDLNTFSQKKIKLLNLALWFEETSISFISNTQIGDSTSSVIRENKKVFLKILLLKQKQ